MKPPALRTFCQSSASTFLDKAYVGELKTHVTLERFKAAKAELSVDLRRFPRLHSLARQQPKLAQALILLHAHATDSKRKIDGTPAYLHSCEIAEDFLRLTKKIIIAPDRRVRAAIKITLHDGIEDFGMTGDDIEALFGSHIRRRTELVTAPPTAQLALDFPAVTAGYNVVLPPNATRQDAELLLAFLKEAKNATYEALRADLKTAHKCKIAKHYLLDEAIYRAIDNAHSLLNHTRDIENKTLHVIRPNETIKIPYNAKTLLLGVALQNRTNRRVCHDAILTRLRQMHGKPRMTPRERLRLERASHEISRHFNRIADRYGRALRHPLEKEMTFTQKAAASLAMF